MISNEIKITKVSKLTHGAMKVKSIFLLFKPNEAKAGDLAKQYEGAGDYYLAQGNARKAENAYMRSLEISKSGKTRVKLGNLFLQEHRFAEALFQFDKVLETGSECDFETKIRACDGKRTIYLKSGDIFDSARTSCELGFLRLENKKILNITAAKNDFYLALKHNPKCAEAYHGLAIVERTNNNYRKGHGLGQDNLNSAIRYLCIALEKGFPPEKIYPKLMDEIGEYEKNIRIEKGKHVRHDLEFIGGKLNATLRK